MNERIRALREKSVNTPATVSVERAQLATKFYNSGVAQKEPCLLYTSPSPRDLN